MRQIDLADARESLKQGFGARAVDGRKWMAGFPFCRRRGSEEAMIFDDTAALGPVFLL
jgi:hypothetical protein